jgi:GntR family transcriptional regulator
VLDFRIDTRSGLAPYAQVVQQVKQALRLGWLQPGDKLPTVHEVAASVAINPNTVQKAYKELEHEGLVVGRPGQGTFVQRSLSQSTPTSLAALGRRLERWIAAARAAGLDDDGIMDVVRATMRDFDVEASA